MSNLKKLMQRAAAGQAGGEALNVEDVFSTYLYEGTGDNQTNTVTNSIDLAGEGGMVWTKGRDIAYSPIIFDSERGLETFLYTSSTAAQENQDARSNMSFNSDGYSFGSTSATSWGPINEGNYNFASWTFRKAPKFFDVVTYTGTGAAQTIAHNLGSVPGCIIVKQTNGTRDWPVYHRGIDSTNPSHYKIPLNKTEARANEANIWNDTEPTSTHFTVGSDGETGGNGNTYVAYLFAHNDGDGDFGGEADADIIKCGSYTGNGSSDGPEIDLGFEPQWVMIKDASSSGNWTIYDAMRGWPVGGEPQALYANSSSAEQSSSWGKVDITSTGFKIQTSDGDFNQVGTYIYMAIRRGTKAPESGTEVFAQDFLRSTEANAAGVQYYSGWPVDMSLFSGSLSVGGNHDVRSRLTGDKRMFSNATDAEASAGTPWWDTNEGWKPDSGGSLNTDALTWMWKRAPGYFDAVAYTGNGTAGRTVSHNLTVAPEMMWVKNRSSSSNWQVYHKNLNGGTNPANYWLKLNDTDAEAALSNKWNDTEPTQSVFSVGNSSTCNASGDDYIAYLFASLPGISKVGSFTATGSDVNVDCGFTSGARFVLIKRTNSADDWFVFDTERGIVAGNDARLKLNDTTAEASADNIDPYSAGFTMTSGILGSAGNTYIFYAIA